MLKSNVAFFVYIKKLNKCNTTAVIKAGRGVTPGLTWCHPYFYFLFFCCFIPASPPAAPTTCALAHIQYSACAYMQTCTLKLSSKSCGTHSCHVTPFPFFFSFWSYAYCGMSVTVLITIMGCHTGVGGGRLHGNPGC